MWQNLLKTCGQFHSIDFIFQGLRSSLHPQRRRLPGILHFFLSPPLPRLPQCQFICSFDVLILLLIVGPRLVLHADPEFGLWWNLGTMSWPADYLVCQIRFQLLPLSTRSFVSRERLLLSPSFRGLLECSAAVFFSCISLGPSVFSSKNKSNVFNYPYHIGLMNSSATVKLERRVCCWTTIRRWLARPDRTPGAAPSSPSPCRTTSSTVTRRFITDR